MSDFDDCVISDDEAARYEAPGVHSPTGTDVIRAHGQSVLKSVAAISWKGKWYLVRSKAYPALAKRTRRFNCELIETNQGERYFWLVNVNDPTALKAADSLRKEAGSVTWDKVERRYSVTRADDQFEAGKLSKERIDDLLRVAFGDRVIESPDDPRVAEILKSKSAA